MKYKTYYKLKSFVLVIMLTLSIGWDTAQAQPFAYVTNSTSGTVSVIETASNTVVATVGVGGVGSGSRGVAITPDGAFAYVASSTPKTVSVIETAGNTVVTTVSALPDPFGVAITPDGGLVYVTNFMPSPVSVIETASNTVVATVGVAEIRSGVAITPDGAFAYVTNLSSNTVSVIETASNTVVATVAVGSTPQGVAITPDGSFAYVANINSGTVSVIETADNTVIAVVPVGATARYLAITPDGAFVYVTNFGPNTVSVIETAGNTVVATVSVGVNPIGVAITPDGAFVYVTNSFSNTVSVIETAGNTVIAAVGVGDGPVSVAITPDGTTAVTNANDAGAGSLRQAILDANATPNLNSSTPDIINFNIPGTGPHIIQPNSALPIITDPVVIDGYTQPGASPNTNGPGLGLNTVLKIELDGTNAGASTDGLQISAGGSVVRGLVINRFDGDGIYLQNSGGNIIEGVYIGTDIAGSLDLGNGGAGVSIVSSSPNNTIGGSANSARSVISGNRWEVIADSDGNIIEGNFIGIDATGTSALGKSFGTGILLQLSTNNVIGGTSAGSRNVISGESIGVNIAALASGNRVQGNLIGTDVSGTIALPNGTGVYIQASFTAGPKNNIIGGPAPGEGNVISGNTTGVFVEDDDLVGTTGNLIQGNLVGTDISGTRALGNKSYGVWVRGASNTTVGGRSDGEGNIIANNGQDGVRVGNTLPGGVPPSGVLIAGNSIFSNGGLGIDLEPDGVTPNDPGDSDIGANNLQNFPEITAVGLIDNGDLVFQYSVDSEPTNSTYPLTIQFFASDPGGEGMRFLGNDVYTQAEFSAGAKFANLGNAIGLEISIGNSVVATATDSSGNTSEFSPINTVGMITSVAESGRGDNLPKVFVLHQNYPNPFNPSTTIQFAVATYTYVTVKVFDLVGREVATLVDETLAPKIYKVDFEAGSLPSGVYFYRLEAGEFVETKKLTLLK